jgi:hypothetical protein
VDPKANGKYFREYGDSRVDVTKNPRNTSPETERSPEENPVPGEPILPEEEMLTHRQGWWLFQAVGNLEIVYARKN